MLSDGERRLVLLLIIFLSSLIVFDHAITFYTQYHYKKGIEYFENGDYDEAIKEHTEAISVRKKYIEAYCGRGMANYEQNKYDFALRDFSQAIIVDPECKEAYQGRGLVYLKRNEVHKALADEICMEDNFTQNYTFEGIRGVGGLSYEFPNRSERVCVV